MEHQWIKISEAARRLGVTAQTLRNWEKSGQLKSFRFHAAGNRLYRESDLLAMFHRVSEGIDLSLRWAAFKVADEPPAAFYCRYRDHFSTSLWKKDMEWKKVLGEEKGALVTALVGEIGNNSFDHNLGKWPDLSGIWFEWLESSRHIVLADRGVGLLNSLRQVRPSIQNHQEAMKVAFNEVLTGRAPERRGNGLKFVKSVVLHHRFHLSFQSGNSHLTIKDGKEFEIKKAKNTIQGCLAVLSIDAP